MLYVHEYTCTCTCMSLLLGGSRSVQAKIWLVDLSPYNACCDVYLHVYINYMYMYMYVYACELFIEVHVHQLYFHHFPTALLVVQEAEGDHEGSGDA